MSWPCELACFEKADKPPVQIEESNHPPMANTLFVFLYFSEQFSCRSGPHQAIFCVLPVIRLWRWCLQSPHCVPSTLHLHRIFILHVCHCVILRYRCCVWQKRVWWPQNLNLCLNLFGHWKYGSQICLSERIIYDRKCEFDDRKLSNWLYL